jgi:hypothetical protein
LGAILDCAFARWSPRIGDPTAVGWITVAAYALAAALAFGLAATPVPGRTRYGVRDGRRERVFWALAALYLGFLAVNKQLDLQTLMTEAGRCAARAQGWYAMRRTVQVDVILGLVGASVAAGLLALWLFRWTLGRIGIALLGLVAVTCYVLVRAVGFHHVDRLIATRLPGGLHANAAFELGAIGVFVLGAAWAIAVRRRRSRHRGRR